MATHHVEPSLARLFNLGIDGELPTKVEEWKEALAKGDMTDEMVRVFHGLGWLSSLRDPRIVREEPALPGTPWSEVKRPETPERRKRIDTAKDGMAEREAREADASAG